MRAGKRRSRASFECGEAFNGVFVEKEADEVETPSEPCMAMHGECIFIGKSC